MAMIVCGDMSCRAKSLFKKCHSQAAGLASVVMIMSVMCGGFLSGGDGR